MRYARLYLHFLRFSFSRALEFRLDFFFRILMDVIFYAVNLGFFTVLYRHTTVLGGWSLDETYLFVCAYLLVDALQMTIVSNNMWWLPIFINRGDLDYYLTRPVSTLFFLSLRDFAANSFVNVVIAFGLLAWALARYPAPLGAGRVALFALGLCGGVLVLYLLRLLFIVPIFWLHSGRGLDEVCFSLDKLAERPDQIYGAWLRRALFSVLPLAFVASVPTRALLSGPSIDGVAYVAVVTLLFFVAVVLFWRLGLRAYSSASS